MEAITMNLSAYGHAFEITFTEITPFQSIAEAPDNVLSHIFDQLAEMNMQGEFEAQEYINSNGDAVKYKGTWRVIPTLDFALLLRVAIWVNNYGPDEGLSKELFAKTYGSVMGDHYLTKWDSVYRHNIISMVAYFGNDSKDGQRFVDMVMRQTTKYEQRIKAKHNERRT